jgi:hypothetical protein
MKFELASFRSAHHVMGEEALAEVTSVVEGLSFSDVRSRWATMPRSGPQAAFNEAFEQSLSRLGWSTQVQVFAKDPEFGKGIWTMDFRKEFSDRPERRVGIEVTFNHAEGMAWTVSRLDLANEAEQVLPGARIDCGVVILPTDELKAFKIRKMVGGPRAKGSDAERDYKMDSSVGTYKRLRTMLPKMRNFVKVPLLIVALHPEEGGQHGELTYITMDTPLHGQTKLR